MAIKHSAALVIALAAALYGCKSTERHNSGVKDVIPFAPEDRVPIMGNNYDSLKQLLLDSPSCITGTSSTMQTAESKIRMSQNIESAKIMQEYTGEVKGTPRKPFFASDANFGFYRSLDSTDSTLSIVYAAKIVQTVDKLNDVTIKPEIRTLPIAEIMSKCGDEYVSQINKGGLLTIDLNFDFGTVQRRKKWQSLVNFTGPWSSIFTDIKSKLESTSMEGTLTVRANQIGGKPNEALLAVKSCSLNTAEDFQKCHEQMMELINYAANSFPLQVQTNPTVLNYQTMPLSSLGMAGFPDIDPAVLKVRKELDLLARDYAYMGEMIEFAKTKKLVYETSDEKNVDYNRQLIKDTARVCFDYKLTSRGEVDWSRCTSAYAGLGGALKPITRENIYVRRFAVPSNAPNGYSLINHYGSKIKVAYSIDENDVWNYGTSLNIRYDAIDPTTKSRSSVSSACMKPTEPKGRMLMRTAQGYQPADRTGTMEIFPGEAVGFVMNDERHLYRDNRGSINIYWRCLNCQDGAVERPTMRVLVPALEEKGVVFKNHENVTANYSLIAYGQWRNASSQDWTDARGTSKLCGAQCYLPETNNQTLMATRNYQNYNVVGASNKFTLAPDESIYFMINDERGGFKDNEGELELILQCTNCGG